VRKEKEGWRACDGQIEQLAFEGIACREAPGGALNYEYVGGEEGQDSKLPAYMIGMCYCTITTYIGI
jgi:hypothetical protein